MQYFILKQFLPGAQIWVEKLNEEDPQYAYPTLEQAETAFPQVQELYPNNLCKVSDLMENAI